MVYIDTTDEISNENLKHLSVIYTKSFIFWSVFALSSCYTNFLLNTVLSLQLDPTEKSSKSFFDPTHVFPILMDPLVQLCLAALLWPRVGVHFGEFDRRLPLPSCILICCGKNNKNNSIFLPLVVASGYNIFIKWTWLGGIWSWFLVGSH